MSLAPSAKLITRSALAELVQHLKRQGKTIVTTNGSFDLLHIGHVTMLQEARTLGDVLIVGLNSDASIQRYKGRSRPICPQAHRAGMLAALACTDYITIFDELTPIELLRVIRPHIHVNSPEHGKDCVEREVVEHYGGQIHLARLVEGMSTTQLLKKIVDASTHQPCQGLFLPWRDLLRLDPDALRRQTFSEDTIQLLSRCLAPGFRLFLIDASETGPKPAFEPLLDHLRQMLRPVHSSIAPTSHAGLIEQIVDEFDVVLAKSFLISSDWSDIHLGRKLNSKTIFLTTPGGGEAAWGDKLGPNYTVGTLRDLARLMRTLFPQGR